MMIIGYVEATFRRTGNVVTIDFIFSAIPDTYSFELNNEKIPIPEFATPKLGNNYTYCTLARGYMETDNPLTEPVEVNISVRNYGSTNVGLTGYIKNSDSSLTLNGFYTSMTYIIS